MVDRYDDRYERPQNFASGVNFLAGLWLIVSPWVFGAVAGAEGATWNSVVVGIVIAGIAAARYSRAVDAPGLSYVTAVLGAWMIATPWAYAYTANVGRTWNSVIVGLIVLVLGVVSATAGRAARGRAAREEPLFGDRAARGYGYGGYGTGEPRWSHGSDGEDERWGYGGRPAAFGGWNRAYVPGGEYRGVGPRGFQRADDHIEAEICERMTDHPQLDARDIDVEVTGGEVRLGGSVSSRFAKRLAEDIADSVSGVREVHNELRVRGTAPGEAPRRAA
jgi:hypothetical protein